MTLRHLRGEVKHIDQNQTESDQQNYPGGNNVLTQKDSQFSKYWNFQPKQVRFLAFLLF